jgi:hypothetical protein
MSFELFPVLQWLDNNGNPLAGGLISTFIAGTNTPQATYTDSTGGTPQANPVVLDSAGRAQIWFAAASYKLVLKTASGVTLMTIDNVSLDNLAAAISSLSMTGNLTMQQPTAATAGANQSSSTYSLQGTYWNGAASATDTWQFQNVIGAGTNPTSTLTLTHSGSSGAVTIDLSAATLKANLKNLNNIRFADQFQGSDMGAKIAAAIADLPAGGGIVDATAFQGAQAAASTITVNKAVKLLLGTVTLSLAGSPGINLSTNGAGIIGLGWNVTNLSTSSGTADVVETNALGNYVSNLSIISSVARTGGAGLHPLGGDGNFTNLTIDKTFNGINLSDSLAGANGNNKYTDIIMGSLASSGSWNCGVFIGNIASGTIPVQIFERLIIQGGPYATAMVQLDSGADTILFTDCIFSVSTDSPGVIIANNSTAQNPHLVRFRGCIVEPGPTKECFTIFNTQSLSIVNCSLDDCVRAVDILGGKDITIEGCTIDGPQTQGITITAPATGVRILNNRIADTSFQTNAASNSIEIGPAVTDFIIVGNDFTSISSTNKPGFNVNIETGASDRYIIAYNLFANNVSGGFSDNGSGVNKLIAFNSPFSAGSSKLSGVILNGTTPYNRLRANQGSALVTADVSGITNFGTTATCSAVAGTDGAGTISIASSGTGQAANGQFVLTFHDGTWATAPVCVVCRADGNGPNAASAAVATTATQATFFFLGLPVAGTTYVFNFICIGK